MNYTSTVTSKGTITLPADFRRQLGLTQGTRVEIVRNSSGRLEISGLPSVKEIRAMNKTHLSKTGKRTKLYRSGDGFTAHVRQKYGRR